MTLAKTLWRVYVLSQHAERKQLARARASENARKAAICRWSKPIEHAEPAQTLHILRSRVGIKGNWNRWHRDRVVTEHMPQVAEIARKVAPILPRHLDIRELEQQGYVGLMQAAKRYDPASGKPFAAFAYFRIRGAIIDANRRAAYREETHDSVEGMTERLGFLPGSMTDPAPLADETLMRRQMEAMVAEVIKALPREERMVLQRAMAGESTAEIAKARGLSVARIRGLLAATREKVAERVREVAG